MSVWVGLSHPPLVPPAPRAALAGAAPAARLTPPGPWRKVVVVTAVEAGEGGWASRGQQKHRRWGGWPPPWAPLGPVGTFPIATSAAHSCGWGRRVLGEIVRWSLHQGPETTSECHAALTTAASEGRG